MKFFEWCEGMKYYPDIAKSIKGAKRVKGLRKEPLTISQVRELLNIKRETVKEKRDYVMLNLMIRTGLRTIEVIRADIGDIRQESGETLLYIQGKERDCKDYFVLLAQDTLKPIMEYLSPKRIAKNDEPLFCSTNNRNMNEKMTTH